MKPTRKQLALTLALLFAINFMNFYDRQVVGAIGEKIKLEWQLSDTQLGGLTTAFVLLYAVVGIPLGRLADVGRRRLVLALGVILWSVFTGLSGVAGSFAALFAYRLGVGVGEASCAPAANSLIGDLFPAPQRARALSIFMLGLPLGLGASYLVSGLITQATGSWRTSLFVAAAPGLVLGLLAFYLPEPVRGASDPGIVSTPKTQAGSIRAILKIPTMWWIIISGALFNLNMYAMGAFMTSLLIRYHGLDIDHANRFNSVIYGFGGGFGMLFGGWLGDRAARVRVNARMQVAAIALLAAAPLTWLALEQPRGDAWRFAALMLPGVFLLYHYYSAVYATIQDIVEPAIRGTAMSVYFFVFYLFTAFGLFAFGRLSDAMAARALASGAAAADSRALGLHGAMYVIPVVSVVLVLVLWAGSRTVLRDHARLHGRV
ncbi:MAG: MFS transporter [Gemmatimonadota bacterium]